MVRFVSILTVVASIAVAANAFTFRAWSSPNFAGRRFETKNRGAQAVGFLAKSYNWDSPILDRCCIKFCHNGRETGNTCPSRRNSNVSPPNQFNQVVIGCGSTVLRCPQGLSSEGDLPPAEEQLPIEP